MKNKTIEIISEKREYYRRMADICDSILAGKSMSEACRDHNITVQGFRNRLFKNNTRMSTYNQKELLKIAEDNLGPEEQILKDILESFRIKYRPVTLFRFPRDFEETVKRLIDELPDDRMKDIIHLYYYENKTFEEIGNMFNISTSRVGQIIHKCLIMLSREDKFFRLIYGDTEYFNQVGSRDKDDFVKMMLDEIMKAIHISSDIDAMYIYILSNVRRLQAEYHTNKKENMPEGVHIRHLGLATRTYNRLIRETSIRTIDQLASMSDKDLLRVPNFGRKCLEDVKSCLSNYYETINRA